MADIRQLQLLIAIAEHGGFRRAAAAVYLTQPALTKSIQNLEKEFGTQLLDRRHRVVVPTPAGEIVIERARKILDDLYELKREVDLFKGLKFGKLMVGCDPQVAKSLIAPALANLVSIYPKLRYEVEVLGWSKLRRRLLDRQIDLHVGAPLDVYGNEVSTIALPLSSLVYFCRAGHPLACKQRVMPEETLDFPRIGTEAFPVWTRMYAELFGFEQDSDEAQHFRFAKLNDWETLKKIVMMTDSISAGPIDVIRTELDAGALQVLNLVLPDLKLFATVAYLSDRVLPPAAKALINEIKRVTFDPNNT